LYAIIIADLSAPRMNGCLSCFEVTAVYFRQRVRRDHKNSITTNFNTRLMVMNIYSLI